MADPLSIAASIAGLMSLADMVFSRVTKFAKAIQNVDAKVSALAKEINTLSGTLHSLSSLARTMENESWDATLRVHQVASCSSLLSRIEKRLKDAETDLDNPNHLRRIKRKLKWPYSLPETEELLDEMQRRHESMHLALSADSMNALLESLARQKDTQHTLSEVAQNVESIKKATDIEVRVRLSEQRRKVRDYFMRISPQSRFEMSKRLRHPLTGLWLTHVPEFQNWLSIPNSRLWLSGIPGAGKTVLTSIVIEEAAARSNENVAVAFFYCDYRDDGTLQLHNILGALVSQVAIQKTEAFDMAEKAYHELHPESRLEQTASPNDLIDLIRDMSNLFEKVYIIIDGLDECASHLVPVVKALSTLNQNVEPISVALISRNEPRIRNILADDFVELEISAHSSDVREYVSAEVEERVRMKDLRVKDPNLKDEIVESLINGAQGMFRWVACQLDHLCELHTDKARREALKKLPAGLTETYMRILARVPESSRGLVKNTLEILAFARHEVRISELCHLLTLSDDEDASALDAVSEDEVLRSCSSLIRRSNDGNSFEFAHFSVREFLESEALANPDTPYSPNLKKYFISKSACHRNLAIHCLRYLQFNEFSHIPHSTLDDKSKFLDWREQREQTFPFHSFASINWIYFARDCLDEEAVFDLATVLFDPRKTSAFVNWIDGFQSWLVGKAESAANTRECPDLCFPQFRPIHVAAAVGLPEICNYLIENNARVDVASPMGTALECAIGGIALLVDEALISTNASILAELYNHIGWNTVDVTQVVASLAKEVTSISRLPPTEICETSHLSLAIHCSVYLESFDSFIALHSVGIALQEQDIDTFEQVSWRWVACSRVEAGFWDLMEYLSPKISEDPLILKLCHLVWGRGFFFGLKFTRDFTLVNSQISLSDQSLSYQAFSAVLRDDPDGLRTVLKDPRLILDFIVEGDHPILHAAVLGSSAEIVTLLLEAGCDMSKQEEGGFMPIHCIGQRNQYVKNDTAKILHVLVDHGCSVSSQMSNGWSIWYDEDYIVIEALLDMDFAADINDALRTTTYQGMTPLSHAIRYGLEEKVALLTSRVANPCDPSWLSAPPFQDAAESGSEVIVQLLLDAKFDPAASVTEGMNPLHRLCPHTSVACTRLLKGLYPDLCGTRHEERLPVELYIQKCLKSKISPLSDVLAELCTEEILKAKDSQGMMVWDFLLRGELSSELQQDDFASHSLISTITSMLEIGAMEAYENETQTCGLLPAFAKLNNDGHGHILSLPADLVQLLIDKSRFWEDTRVRPDVVRWMKSCIRNENAKMIHTMLIGGVDVHQRVGNSSSALEFACWYGLQDASIFPRMLEHANLNQLDDLLDGLTLLHCLADSDHKWAPDMTRQLLERGANPNIHSPRIADSTPLLLALYQGAIDIARVLLEYGADPTLTDRSGYDAPLMMAYKGSPDLLENLKMWKNDQRSINWTNTVEFWVDIEGKELSVMQCNALHIAAAGGHVQCLKAYIEKDVITDGNSRADFLYTPLHLAAMFGHWRSIEYLCEKGADVNALSMDNSLPIHFAVRNKHVTTTQALIRLGSKQGKDASGRSPLSYALLTQNEELIASLPDAPDPTGGSACNTELSDLESNSKSPATELGLNIDNGDLDACVTIWRRGCNLNATMGCGCSPLIRALCRRRTEIVQWLLRNGASVTSLSCISHGASSGLELTVKSRELDSVFPNLLDRLRDDGDEWLDELGRVLYIAVRELNIFALTCLIEHIKANTAQYSGPLGMPEDDVLLNIINQRIAEKQHSYWTTLLHRAVDAGALEIVELLLRHGADANLRDEEGQTPFLQALQASHPHVEIMNMLLKHGADPELRECNGDTSATLAGLTGDISIINYIMAQSVDISACDAKNYTVLHNYLDSDECRPTELRDLLEKGLDLMTIDWYGTSPLHLALCRDEFISMLLNGDYQVHSAGPFPWNELFNAFTRISNSKIRLFKRKGLTRVLITEPTDAWSPLCRFACGGVHETIEELLIFGANVDFEGCPDGTALMVACAEGNLNTVKLLVRWGAKLWYSSPNGIKSAFDKARRHERVLSWLLVGRHTERILIEQVHASSEEPCQPWSGPVKKGLRLVGRRQRQAHESMKDYIVRLEQIRKEMRGRIVR